MNRAVCSTGTHSVMLHDTKQGLNLPHAPELQVTFFTNIFTNVPNNHKGLHKRQKKTILSK